MLYDDADVFPRWIFTLSFLSVTRKASDHVGPNSTCVCKFTEETLSQAFSKGKFIVLATHGAGPGKVYANRQIFDASQASAASHGNHPRFIYLTACSLAKNDDSWNKTFPKAEIVSFNRWSATLEHFLWFCSKGPDKLEQVFQ